MQKIMFNDRFGLTKAVLDGAKTMTRRAVGNHMTDDDIAAYMKGHKEVAYKLAPYKIGEIVSIAQRYNELSWNKSFYDRLCSMCERLPQYELAGWYNKMFVRADLMPHQIQITDIKVERLQDINEEDCTEEGIIPVTWRQYLKQDWNDLSPQKYIDHDVWTLPVFKEGILDTWAESHPDEFMADSPQTAFAVLIFKMMGKKVWDSNPFVFAYTFKLIK